MEKSPDFLGRGWNFPPRVDNVTGLFVMVEGSEDIKQSIRIILLTRINERAMLPAFGSNLHEFVFELPDPASIALLRSEIVSALVRWEPRIIEVKVDVDTSNIHLGTVVLNISYVERITNNPNNLVFPYYLYEGVGLD
ncbi:MAG: GPW/gp25 family protein [Defluviitaleaceae bacterium]|nr:GPW/gp25 family protein [Defluviitaleaceae bacterium]